MIGAPCAVLASVKIYIAGYYAQCAFVSVPGRNNMSGYDQGSHLASLAQTQLSQATARANALALIADVQPACVS